MTIKEKIKDSNRYIIFLTIFLITLLLFYRIIPILYSGSVDFWFNISELDGASAYFSTSVRLIWEIILMGPVFAVIYYFLMKYLLKDIDESHGKNKYYIKLLEVGIITFICLTCMGHIVHMMFDHASRTYYIAHGKQMDTSELYSFLYFADELIGHHLIHIGYFGYVFVALMAEFLGSDHKKLNWFELISVFLLSIGLGIVNYTTFEGQTAFIILILYCILLGIEVIVILIKKINPLKRPILLVTIITSLIVIGLYIWWIAMFGIKSYYPFVYQPSEL
jgi:hypothetical protein